MDKTAKLAIVLIVFQYVAAAITFGMFFTYETIDIRGFAGVGGIILFATGLLMTAFFFTYRSNLRAVIFFIIFMDMILLLGPIFFFIEIVSGIRVDLIPEDKVIQGLILYMLLISIVAIRLATWAVTFSAPDGQPVFSGRELRQRVLTMGDNQNFPFMVRPGMRPDELIMDWKYADAIWFDVMRVHKLAYLSRFVIRFYDTEHVVRVREYQSNFDASAGVGGGRLAFKAAWGINFYHYEKEIVFGVQLENWRPVPKLSYTYTFDINEMRQPLVNSVIQNGWTYKGVLLFAPWLTG